MFPINIKNLEKLKYHIFSKKHCIFLLFIVSGHEYQKIFKEEELVKILKLLGLITNIEEYQKIYTHV